MKTIELTRGKVALVDDDDYDELKQYRWTAVVYGGIWYALRWNGSGTTLMHRQILKAPPEFTVDHINHDGLDNRRANIRLATTAENNRNKRMKRNKASGYKGVSYRLNRTKPWRAEISMNGKRIHIGYYETSTDAALAYDKKAKELFGEFALTNLGE